MIAARKKRIFLERFIRPLFLAIAKFDRRYREKQPMASGWLAPLVLAALIYFGLWFVQDQFWGERLVEFLRARFFIFTQEPRLQIYTRLFFENFVIKTLAVFWVIFLLCVQGKPAVSSLGLNRVPPMTPGLKRILLFFIAFSLAAAFFQWMDPLAPDLPALLFFKDSALVGNILAVFSIVLLAPITEEIIFRGYLYPVFAKKTGAFFSVIINSILFALLHYPQMKGEFFWLGIIFLSGFLIAISRAVSGSTWLAILLHFFYNGILTFFGFIHHGLNTP